MASEKMQVSADANEAATLAAKYGEVLKRLPATLRASILVELQKWPMLFAPEQRYQRALLEHLSRLPEGELNRGASAIARIETEAGVSRLNDRNPARFQDESQALLRTSGRIGDWRRAVDDWFQIIDPVLEAQLYPADAPRRLVIQIYGSGIAVQRDRLWSRFKGVGLRVPLDLEGTDESRAFLQALFGERAPGTSAPAIFAAATASAQLAPLDAWIIESHEALHDQCDPARDATLTGLSYDRLRGYRDDLTRALYARIQKGVESPQAFAAYARSLQISPPPGGLLHSVDIVRAFVRDVMLTGNGTLFVNNTFVEWAAIQALRRAQPRILATRYGVRDKLKPFSSLLLFSRPRASDQIPEIEDPLGSFIDAEQLSYYVWLNAEKSPAYRKKTLYLFLAEGIDEMLAIRSDAPLATSATLAPARLADVCATLAQWLGVPAPERSGQALLSLVG
jgi:hypothetical protein